MPTNHTVPKITLAYEDLNNWALNGRWEHNNKLLGLPFDNPWIKQLMTFFVNPTTSELNNIWTPIYGANINSDLYALKNVSEIGNESYFYPIEVINGWAFFNTTENIAVSKRVYDDVKNGKAYILISYANEGDLLYYKDKINKLINEMNLPKSNILVLHGDHNVNNFLDCPFTYIPVTVFNWWLHDRIVFIKPPIEYRPEKLFVSYNRHVKEDRARLILEFINNNLLDVGHVSCGTLISEWKLTEDEIKILKSLEGLSPDGVKLTGENADNPILMLNKTNFETSFVSVVTETEARTDDILYYTEKIFKPIILGHPFMVLGGKNQLQLLKDMGYKTFDKWWDESYDNESGYENRIKKIISNLLYLKTKTPEELMQMRIEMKDVLKHNQSVCFNTTINQTCDQYITKKLLKYTI